MNLFTTSSLDSDNPRNPTQVRNHHLLIAGIFIIMVITSLTLQYLYLTRHYNSILKAEKLQYQQDLAIATAKKETEQEKTERERKGKIEFFISDYYPLYPKFNSEVKPEEIQNVFFLGLKKISEKDGRGWVVEVKTESDIIVHYLLTPILETKLENVLSCNTDVVNPPLRVSRVDQVGSEVGLGRNLKEISGYIVLSGLQDGCYGGGYSGVISVYAVQTGKKIKLEGNFQQPGSTFPGVSKSGNALGILKDIYGTMTPTIVVEYGRYNGKTQEVTEIRKIAYFDVQTGTLKQLVSFE